MPARASPTGFKPLEDTKLFSSVKLGHLRLEHRVVLAPLTRMRGTKEADGVWVPNDLMVEYYSQRASRGGFMLTEACPISRLVSLEYLLKKELILAGMWLSWRSWNLHFQPDCRLATCYRCHTCQRRLHLLPTVARWSCHNSRTTWWRANA